MPLSNSRRAAWAMAPMSAMRNVLRRKMRRTAAFVSPFVRSMIRLRTRAPTLSLARRRAAWIRSNSGTGIRRSLRRAGLRPVARRR